MMMVDQKGKGIDVESHHGSHPGTDMVVSAPQSLEARDGAGVTYLTCSKQADQLHHNPSLLQGACSHSR